MTEVLQSIISSLGTFLQLVANFIAGIFQMLGMIQAAVPMVTTAVGYLPTPVLAFALCTVTVSVAYLIIGR